MQSQPAAFERYPGAARRQLPASYQRREPEKTALYQIINRNLEACLELARERSDHGYGYPRFVERELEKFLDCGLLRRGFVRVRCSDCRNDRLVAFSCCLQSKTIGSLCSKRD